MRDAFARGLLALAETDDRIVLLTGDLGFMVWEPFAERFPDRFFNVGVSEQNMVGLATGLAESGRIPFVYSIATFASMRAYEFVRNGPVQHRLPVRIVGVGGGFDYGHNGLSHYALEDIALMRAQPDLVTVAPADPAQTRTALDATWQLPDPIYYRLGKQSEAISELRGAFALGRAQTIGEGRDVVIFTLGPLAIEGLRARQQLAEQGVQASVVIVSCVAPPPNEDILAVLGSAPLAITLEAHYSRGGIGSLIAEEIADHGLECRLVRMGVDRVPRGDTGSPAYMHASHGLSAEAVTVTVGEWLARTT